MSGRVQTGTVATVLFGLCFIGAGIYAYFHMGRFLETAQEASGTVVEVVYESGTKKGRIHPVVRFKTREGKEVVGRLQQHHNVQPGQTVQLLYDPANPEHVEIGTLSRANNRRIFFSVLGIAFGLAICGMATALQMRLVSWPGVSGG